MSLEQELTEARNTGEMKAKIDIIRITAESCKNAGLMIDPDEILSILSG
jgi:hypothetical protein